MNSPKVLYVVVERNTTTSEIRMSIYYSEQELIRHIGTVSAEKHVIRIFRVNEYGNVGYYQVVFDGRIKLELQPTCREG